MYGIDSYLRQGCIVLQTSANLFKGVLFYDMFGQAATSFLDNFLSKLLNPASLKAICVVCLTWN